MKSEKSQIKNLGILASISWNSCNWSGEPTEEDLKSSKYDYVKDNKHMHESLNFGQDIFPVEKDGFYIGYTPMFNRAPDRKKAKDVQVIFLMSSDYKNDNQKTVVGFYGLPSIDKWFDRKVKHKFYKSYDGGNIKALPENIVYLETPIVIDKIIVRDKNLIPDNKKIGQQGFNYLNSENVYNFFKLAFAKNSGNDKIKSFILKVPLLKELIEQPLYPPHLQPTEDSGDPDTIVGIRELEEKMKNQEPEVKERISVFIERGAISAKVKRINNYRCSVCIALGQSTNSFKKRNGEIYIETHHVEPVSSRKLGVLSITNLMTICANHHRQMHYGNVKIIENTRDYFKFKIDGSEIIIAKVKIENRQKL